MKNEELLQPVKKFLIFWLKTSRPSAKTQKGENREKSRISAQLKKEKTERAM